MTLFTLFGASGDLAKLKIFPSLFGLYKNGLLPESFILIGYARSVFSRDEFCDLVAQSIHHMATGWTDIDESKLTGFLSGVYYFQGSYDDASSYHEYQRFLIDELSYDPLSTTHLVYLSIPPVIAPQILDHLADVFDPHTSQMRIILEKPFGHDEASATTLFAHLFSRYPRSSLYFLDHYLGKQTLRDLALRDGTSFLSELLALDNIASIEISAIETLDAGSRIGYFDGVGTIEDMMQSHLIQMLAFACLDTSTRSLRAKKIDVLSSLRFSQDKKDIILGQYDEYRGHDTRVSTSDTETYAAIRCTLLHGEESVPVFLRSGKSLHQKSTYIHIHLKDSIIAHAGCEGVTIDMTANQILLHSKNESTKEISLSRKDVCELYHLDAHEVLFLDVMEGDDRFFLSDREIELAWGVIDSVKDTIKKAALTPILYKEKSHGPDESALFFSWYY